MKKVGLCIGHSRFIGGKRDGGAVALDKTTNEWTFNSAVARRIQDTFAGEFEILIFDRYDGNGYTTAMRWVAGRLKAAATDIAIELHFNWNDGLDDGKGTGHEWLFWHTSKKGKLLAQSCKDAEERLIPNLKSRGLLARSADRGAAFLESTHCPAIIGEPFFGDDDWREVDVDRVAKVYVVGIRNYFSALARL